MESGAQAAISALAGKEVGDRTRKATRRGLAKIAAAAGAVVAATLLPRDLGGCQDSGSGQERRFAREGSRRRGPSTPGHAGGSICCAQVFPAEQENAALDCDVVVVANHHRRPLVVDDLRLVPHRLSFTPDYEARAQAYNMSYASRVAVQDRQERHYGHQRSGASPWV
jgi:hypothetical protein